MSDLEKAWRNYVETRRGHQDQYSEMLRDAWLNGANWQKERDAKLFEYPSAFVDPLFDSWNVTPEEVRQFLRSEK